MLHLIYAEAKKRDQEFDAMYTDYRRVEEEDAIVANRIWVEKKARADKARSKLEDLQVGLGITALSLLIGALVLLISTVS